MTEKAKPTVVEALSAVMGDVQAVGKGERNQQQGYNFRGIDSVVNAVGPALRKHGVVVVPIAAAFEDERYKTAKGAQMRGVTMTVSFRFYGPAGDHIDAQTIGESSDAGDKAIPKAHSVAYRVLLLQALCIPTDEPDPDASSHERGGRQSAQQADGHISEAQAKRLFAIANEHKVEQNKVKEIVVEVGGVEHTREIPREKYDAVIAAIEAAAVPF